MEDPKTNTIILIMRPSTERTQIATALSGAATVLAFHTKSDVLKYLKDTAQSAAVALFIADFSDLQIDAWDILEPLAIVKKGVPIYVIAAEKDSFYQDMIGDRVAGVFSRPIDLETVLATVEFDLSGTGREQNIDDHRKISEHDYSETYLSLSEIGDRREMSEKDYCDKYLSRLNEVLDSTLKVSSTVSVWHIKNNKTYATVDTLAAFIKELQELSVKYQAQFQNPGNHKKLHAGEK